MRPGVVHQRAICFAFFQLSKCIFRQAGCQFFFNVIDELLLIAFSIDDLKGVAVASAISGKADTSSLGDLAYIDIDGRSSTKVLQGDGTWVTPSSGGHTMIPAAGDMAAIAALNNGNDNYVINAYSAKRWSNCDAKVVLALASQGDDGIGDWEAKGTWETGSRSGWLWSADLYHVLNDGETPPTTNYDVEVMPVFDGGENETVSLYAFRIDDNVSNGGVNGGAVAFKFNTPIQSANGVRVGVKIINQRTDVTITGTILT